MAAFIPITMASVQRAYIDREIQAAVMSEACLQLHLDALHRACFTMILRVKTRNASPNDRYTLWKPESIKYDV